MPAIEGKYGVITAEKKQFHENEPVFLFRATDPFAPEAIDRYAEQCQLDGCALEHCAAVRAHANRIRQWQNANPALVKVRPGPFNGSTPPTSTVAGRGGKESVPGQAQ